jgi:hypothetical protein
VKWVVSYLLPVWKVLMIMIAVTISSRGDAGDVGGGRIDDELLKKKRGITPSFTSLLYLASPGSLLSIDMIYDIDRQHALRVYQSPTERLHLLTMI